MNIINLNKENFNETINREGLVLVDFWAAWCGPCKMFAPILDKVAAECDDSVSICKLNIDEAPEIAEQHNVLSIPTVVLFKNGKEITRSVGVSSKDTILKMING